MRRAKERTAPKMITRLLSGAAALCMSGFLAHAAITGTWSEKQDEQAAIGQLQIGQGNPSCVTTGTLTPTCAGGSGSIQTTSLATAAGATATVTMSNARIAAGDQVQCTLDPQSSAGTPICANAAVTAGQVVFTIQNISGATALNNTVKVNWILNKAGNGN